MHTVQQQTACKQDSMRGIVLLSAYCLSQQGLQVTFSLVSPTVLWHTVMYVIREY